MLRGTVTAVLFSYFGLVCRRDVPLGNYIFLVFSMYFF